MACPMGVFAIRSASCSFCDDIPCDSGDAFNQSFSPGQTVSAPESRQPDMIQSAAQYSSGQLALNSESFTPEVKV